MSSLTETELAEFDAKKSWNEVFERLKNEASLASLGDKFSIKHAREPDNRRKNRYRDVTPYDHSRVKLSGKNDYINASFVEVPEASRKYILTQGPLEHTMDDFWLMVWEQKSKAIVMLNNVIEKGSLKCSQYWPLGEDYGHEQEMYFEECGIRVSLTAEQDFQHFTLRALEMEYMETGDKRVVLHFQYTIWPDFGVPASPNSFLHFLNCVRESRSLESDVGPAIIHCSAGIGRSGTFCLVDSCLVMVENNGTLKNINIRKLLIKMRTYRMGLIQTADQLRFSYVAIIQGAHLILEGNGLPSLPFSQNETPPVNLPPNNIPQPPTPEIVSLSESQEEPPPLPPKKAERKHVENGWGEEEEEEEEEEEIVEAGPESGHASDEEFDKLIDRTEEDSLEDSLDSDDEIRVETIHQIRDERKKSTRELISHMKERQLSSERCKPKNSQHSMYIGLAVLAGVAAYVVYKYVL